VQALSEIDVPGFGWSQHGACSKKLRKERVLAMDEQQQQRINQAAEEFANALKESYQTVASRGESAYDLNAQLTEQFFNSVVNNLQTQAEENRQVTEQLADQARRGQEASQQLTQESVQAYMEFVDSMFSFAKAGPKATKRGEERSR